MDTGQGGLLKSSPSLTSALAMLDLSSLHQSSFKNRLAVESCHPCACFHCQQHFQGKDVTQWADQGQTALCPRCGIDAVLVSPRREEALPAALVSDMHQAYFGQIERLAEHG